MARNSQHRRRKREQEAVPQFDKVLDGLEPTVTGYSTVYVDLLGMSHALTRFDELKAQPGMDIAGDLVRRTAIPILLFRRHFHQYFDAFFAPKHLALPAGMPAEALPIWREFHGSARPLVQGFSDCVAISVQLDYSNRLGMVRALYAQLHATAGAALTMACTLGQFVRGGIALGYGCVVDGKEVIGAGIAKAAKLEKAACYPRVRVDQELVDFLRLPVPSWPGQTVTDQNRLQLEVWLRQRTLGLLVQDGAEWYLDILHAEVREGYLPLEQVLEKLEGQAQAQRERAMQSDMSQEEREKVAKKYDWVLEQVDLVRGRNTTAQEGAEA